MALEAVVFQQELFGHQSKDLYTLLGGNWDYEFDQEEKPNDFLENQTENLLHGDWNSPMMELYHPHFQNSPSTDPDPDGAHSQPGDTSIAPVARPKRRRAKSRKNKEEIENQRMTHIAVERNRRKQMNEYLLILRSLMPESYVQRSDQASIIGAAINFVKELEHKLHLLTAQKEKEEKLSSDQGNSVSSFDECFTFPVQFSTMDEKMEETQYSTMADIKVNLVESHANIKIRCKKRESSGQLLKLASGLNGMRLTILHLSMTTVDVTVLYSISVKVEDDCKLTSVDDIAAAVYQLLERIEDSRR